MLGVNYKCKCNQACYYTFNKQGSFHISIVLGKICVFLLKQFRGVLSQLTSVSGFMWVPCCSESAEILGQITYSSKHGKRKQYLCVLSHWDERWKIVCRWSAIVDFFVEVLSMFSDYPVSTNVQYALISRNAIKDFYMCISSCLFPAAASTSQVRDRRIFFNSLCFFF